MRIQCRLSQNEISYRPPQNAGYDVERVLALSVTLKLDLSGDDYPAQMLSFGSQLLAQVQALPGVVSAGIYTSEPMLQDAAFAGAFPMYIEGQEVADPDGNPLARIHFVTEDYFSTLDIPLLQGRLFTRDDDPDAVPVAILNESAARLFPGGTTSRQ